MLYVFTVGLGGVNEVFKALHTLPPVPPFPQSEDYYTTRIQMDDEQNIQHSLPFVCSFISISMSSGSSWSMFIVYPSI